MHWKDGAKLAGVFIMTFCAVLVCALFLNYNLDIVTVEDAVGAGPARVFYDAQVLTAKVVCAVSGGCLLATSVVMLLFYIKHYIDTHKKELGILKAMGYSDGRIAVNFWVFGFSTLLGTMCGYLGAQIMMPKFYRTQNADGLLPEISARFHPALFFCLVILPSAAFGGIAVAYACRKLKRPALELLKETDTAAKALRRRRRRNTGGTFRTELKRTVLREKKILAFFITFAAFCFSAMTQMASSMRELSSVMMGVMILLIGIVLACTTLFLAITTVVRGNTKTIAMMRVFGYSQRECCAALLGVYRPLGYLGFAIGTVYQYALLKIMVSVVFSNVEGVPEYNFDFLAMAISLTAFAVFYETAMFCCAEKIKKIPLRQIMLE